MSCFLFEIPVYLVQRSLGVLDTQTVKTTVLDGFSSIDLCLWFAGDLIVLYLFFLFETIAAKQQTWLNLMET